LIRLKNVAELYVPGAWFPAALRSYPPCIVGISLSNYLICQCYFIVVAEGERVGTIADKGLLKHQQI
jgi:hypothetical protein